ncbi:hypothetical protein ACIPX0_30195 [Streptomyces sp. NPDC090075]|uniref:hypothetical protein n=1 Tax=Streptomyces sp. NPDC090075 TaxID=3365937 RepID=UPI0038164C61
MAAGTGTEVRVTRGEDGTVRIAAAPGLGHAMSSYDDVPAFGPDFTRAVLDVAGAVLVWPVLGEPGPPTAEIHDAGRAQQWLWAVYGERVAAAVHDAGAGQPTDARVAAETPALAGAAARLGFAHWAARWWPASYPDGIAALEPDVLGLETAALTHRCQQLFDDLGDQPDDCAADLIEEHWAALAPLLRWWHSSPQQAYTTRHLDRVLRLVDSAADCAGLDGTALRRIRSALDEGPEHGRSGAPADPATLFTRQAGYALAAGDARGAGGRVIARGTGTNDWRRYPPGLVDSGEHAVSWTARALGARRHIEVEIVAHVSAPAGIGVPLVAEVRVGGGPPHRVPLTRRDDLWTGRAEVDLTPAATPSASASAPLGVDVGVLLPGFDPGAGTEARADRDAVRALTRRRLADAAQAGAAQTGAAQTGADDAHDDAPGPHDDVRAPLLAETLAALAATSEDY